MGWPCSAVHVRLLVLVVLPYSGSVWVDGVVEYMSDSWYWYVTILRVSVRWWCNGVHVRLYGSGGVAIERVSVGWGCSGVYIRLLVLVMLPY